MNRITTTARHALLATGVIAAVATVATLAGARHAGSPASAPTQAVPLTAPAAPTAVAAVPAATAERSAAVLGAPTSLTQVAGVALGNADVVDEAVFHRAGEQVSAWRHMGDLLSYVHHKNAVAWGEAFLSAGYQAPAANARFPMPGESLRTACSDDGKTFLVTDDTSAFYCPADDTIYISQKWAIDLYNGSLTGPLGQRLSPAVRDFTVAFVVAHEFGHAIQHEIGIRSAVIGTPAFEQQADCLAGVWAAQAAAWGMLDPGDVQEALATAWLLGDRGDDHGTGAQRQAAVTLGMTQGVGGCASYSR